MRARSQLGTTLIENMIAMAVLAIAAAGIMGLGVQGRRQVGMAAHVTRASALGQDLLQQIELWHYDDPRLANANAANDGDVYDTARTCQTAAPNVDHGEADLTLGGATWAGAAAVGGYQRFWNVAPGGDANGNGRPDGIVLSVIVRWQDRGGYGCVILPGAKPDPAEEAQ